MKIYAPVIIVTARNTKSRATEMTRLASNAPGLLTSSAA